MSNTWHDELFRLCRGYMAPEYALWGYLSYKADVYSFGVVVLEIVSGQNNNSFVPSEAHFCILDWVMSLRLIELNFISVSNADTIMGGGTESLGNTSLYLQAYYLYQSDNLMQLVDGNLRLEFDKKEAEMVLKVALLCTHASPAPRPTMPEVVGMLEGRMAVPETIPGPGTLTQDPRFRATRDLQELRQVQSQTGSESQHSSMVHTFCSSAGSEGIIEINPEKRPYLS